MANYSGGPGFKSAISYYGALKRQFIKQCEEKYTQEQQIQLEDVLRTFNNKQYNRYQEFQKVKGKDGDINALEKLLQSTGHILASTASGDTATIQSQLDSLKAAYEAQGQKATAEIQAEYQRIIGQIRTILLADDDIMTSIKQIVNKSSGGVTLDAVENEYVSYISRQITKRMTAISQIFDLNQAAIAGYYQEATETTAMNEIMQKFGSKAMHAGTLISQKTKRETPMDIVLGGKQRGKSLKVQALEDYDKMLSYFEGYNESAEASQTLPDWEAVLRQMKVKTAGIQSKLYTINFSKPRPKGYGIGNRAGLLRNFYAWSKRQAITQALSAEFFNESRTAIIEAFGPTTLLFRSGSQRFFMDELLQELENYDYMIAFNLTAEKKLTSYVIMTKTVNEDDYAAPG